MKRTLLAMALAALCLTGCALPGGSGAPVRQIHETPTPKAVSEPKTDNESALKLARLLVEQGRLEASLGVYGQLDQKKALGPKELLEFASVAALVEPPKSTYALFSRTAAEDEEHPDVYSAEERGALYAGLGRAELARGNLAAAKKALAKALQVSPANVPALNAMGVLLDAEGSHEEALQSFKRALAEEPENPQVLANIGLSHLSAVNAKLAVASLEEAKATGKAPVSVDVNLALAQFLGGDEAQARKTLEAVMRRNQAAELVANFKRLQTNVKEGGAPLSEALLEAARKSIQIRPMSDDAPEPVPVINLTPDGKPIVSSPQVVEK